MLLILRSRVSVINTVTKLLSWRLRSAASIPGKGNMFFFFSEHPDFLWGQPPLYSVAIVDFFQGKKAAGLYVY
jgi:hypothetical protein